MVSSLMRTRPRLARTPDQTMEYLNGTSEFPDDTPEVVVCHPSEGDCISRMDRREQAKNREEAWSTPGLWRRSPQLRS
jgi:hypothetical protein